MNALAHKNREPHGRSGAAWPSKAPGRRAPIDDSPNDSPRESAQRTLQASLNRRTDVRDHVQLRRALNDTPRAVAQARLSEALSSGSSDPRSEPHAVQREVAQEVAGSGPAFADKAVVDRRMEKARVVQMVPVTELHAPDPRYFKITRPEGKVWIGQLNRVEGGFYWFRDIDGNDYGIKSGDVEPLPAPPEYTANQLLRILRAETPGGEGFYQGVVESAPKTPTIELGDGVTNTDLGTFDILIDYRKPKRQALTALVFELSNAAAWKDFRNLDRMAAAGRVSRTTYWREIERLEFENAFYNQFVWLLNNMKNRSWGEIDEGSQALLLNYRGLTFNDYVKKSQHQEGFLDHVQHSADRWNAKYKDAHELYISEGGKDLYQPQKSTVQLPYFELPSERKQ